LTPPTQSHSLIFITGPSGVGKSIYAADLALNGLRSGKHICIVDFHQSHLPLVKALGGSSITLYPDGPPGHERFGDAPLLVYEMRHFARRRQTLEALPVPAGSLEVTGRRALLIVDEL
jgi:CO dehydrogenase nickel-insertion accessory protein CooC1